MSGLPLTGYTVVSLEQAVAAPFATRQLADLGARVIKVERPRVGDFARDYDDTVHGEASHFVWLNRSKESLTLDLKQSRGVDVLLALLDTADVFVQNLSPGAAERLGLASGMLQSRNGGLVQCHISGYGASGDYAAKKAYDLLIQAESGLLSITGTPEEPAKAGISVADIAAGMYAYSNILAALLARGRGGGGRVIEVSMLEALAEWMGYPFYYDQYGGSAPPRTGAFHATIAPYGPVNVGDGGQLIIGIQNEREWHRLCANVLETPALADDPRFESNSARMTNRKALEQYLEKCFRLYDADELERLLDEQQIACARMRDMRGFAAHPQMRARRRWSSVALPDGERVDALLPPGCSDEQNCRMDPVPAVGEHNEAILAELGYDAGHVAELRARQVL